VVKFPGRRTGETPFGAPLEQQAPAKEEGNGPIATKLVAANADPGDGTADGAGAR
jgi:hypothetical protein